MKSMFKGLCAAVLMLAAPMTMAATVVPVVELGNHGAITWEGDFVDPADLTLWVPIRFTGSGGTLEASASSTPVNVVSMRLYQTDDTFSGFDPSSPIAVATEIGSVGEFFVWGLKQFITKGNYILELVTDGYASVHGNFSAAPLPGAALLFGSALLGAGVIGRKKLARQKNEVVSV